MMDPRLNQGDQLAGKLLPTDNGNEPETGGFAWID